MEKTYMDLAQEELTGDINKAAASVGKKILTGENSANKRLAKLKELREELNKALDVNDVRAVGNKVDAVLGE